MEEMEPARTEPAEIFPTSGVFLLESPKYGVLIHTGGKEYYTCDGGQLRRLDTTRGLTRQLWGENGCQPYEAALLQSHPQEYLPIEVDPNWAWPWLLRQPLDGRASSGEWAGSKGRPLVRHGAALCGYGEGHWADSSGGLLYRIFAEQVIQCRLDESPLAEFGHDIRQVTEDRAHNLWFYLWTGLGHAVSRVVCKHVEDFVLTGPESAVDVVDRGSLDVQVAQSWQDERPLQLFWRTDGCRWRTGEIGPLTSGSYRVELIAMGPQGETTPKSIHCTILARGQAAWVMPHLVGHDMEGDPVLQQALKGHGVYGTSLLENAVKRSPHNVYYWAALVDALAQRSDMSLALPIMPAVLPSVRAAMP